MHDLWHFEQEMEGWRWVHTDLDSGEVCHSDSFFLTRSACMLDALGNGYLASRRAVGPSRNAIVH